MIFVSLRSRFDDPPWLAVSILKDIIHGTLMAGLGNAIFHGWAWALVNCENYETEGKRDKHLIYTFFAMDFWNMFVLLFLLAFFFIPLKHGGWYAHAFHVEGTPLNQLWWSLFDTPVHNATIIQGRLDWEKMEIVMIGPIVVMRILITITMSVLPFCMQRRRRAAVRKAMAQRSAHLKEWFTTVTFLVKPAKWARSKVIGTAVEVGKGVRDRTYSMSASVRDRTYSMSASVGKTLARSTSFMRQSTANSQGSDSDTNYESKRSGSCASDSSLSDDSSDLLSLPGERHSCSMGSSDLEHGGAVFDTISALVRLPDGVSSSSSSISASASVTTAAAAKSSESVEYHRTLSTIQSIGSSAEQYDELQTSSTRVLRERLVQRSEEEQGGAGEKSIEMTGELSALSRSLTDLDSSMASRQSDFAWAEKTSGDPRQCKHTSSDHWMEKVGDKKAEILKMRARLQAVTILQQYHRAHRARSIVFERRMALKSADDLVEECGAGEFEMFFIYVDLLVSARFFCRDASCVCGMFHFVCCSFILITDPPVPVPRPPCVDILKNNHTDAIRNSHFFHLCCALDCGDHGRRGRI